MACGKGTTAVFLAKEFGCDVFGVDYGDQNVEAARSLARAENAGAHVQFERSDAESLPFSDGSFDAVICECAFCTFPDKAAAAREFFRVLRRGGHVGIGDLTRAEVLPKDLDGLLAWIACIGDAQTVKGYVAYLQEAGFSVDSIEQKNDALKEMVDQVRMKLLGAEIMAGLNKLQLPGIDLGAAKRMADGRALRLIKATLKAGSYGKGQLFPSERGTPQGGVVSPTLSNILLTPFDREMRLRGYQLTRYADDWVITCKSAAEARAAMEAAGRILKQLGVELHPQKTRIVHVRYGFEFLGYKIKRGKKLHLPESKIRSQARSGALYAYPREKSIQRFQDQVRQRTKRRVPLKTPELIAKLNPLLRGWGEYYKRAHVRTLFNQLDRWIVRRIWSHRFKRWRNGGWKQLPAPKLYGEYELVNLVGLIPSIASRRD